MEAYNFASEAKFSPTLNMLSLIERFGLEAITGQKVFLNKELRALMTAENIVTAFRSRAASSNWVAWAESNPRLAHRLLEIEKDFDAN